MSDDQQPLDSISVRPRSAADEPAPADRQLVVGALSHAAADLGWHPIAAHSTDTEITFVCRPG